MFSSNSLLKKCLQINEEFKYYQPINGKFLDHVSEVLHKAFEPLEEKRERKITEAMKNKDLDKDEKKEAKMKFRR